MVRDLAPTTIMKLVRTPVPLPFLQSSPQRIPSRCLGVVRRPIWISSLKPDELRSSDFLEMSHGTMRRIRIGTPESSGYGVPPTASSVRFGQKLRFPDHTRGFLYYHSPVGLSPIASSIRFRCTPSDDPATFEQGKDLLNRFGLPWELSMISILRIRSTGVRDYLIRAGLVTEDQIAHFKHIHNRKQMHNVLGRLDLPFSINFQHPFTNRIIIVGSLCQTIKLYLPFADRRNIDGCKRRIPYRGSALARFELSTLPEHSGSQQVVLRCLKFQDPVTCDVPNYDGWVPFPREGELIYGRKLGGSLGPFTFRIDQDTPRSRALKSLLELPRSSSMQLDL